MSASPHRWWCRLVAVAALGLVGGQAIAETSSGALPQHQTVAAPNLVLSSSMLMQEEETVAERTEVTTTDSGSPFSFDVSYSLYSDYVWRGINLSEYAREGREKPNHQLDVSMTVDLGPLWGEDPGTCGTFGFSTWFEWYAAQKVVNPVSGGQNLQQTNYYLSWSYDLESIATMLELGYRFYTYPNVTTRNTQEWSITLEHDDAWMWKWLWPDNEDGVLNPSFMLAQDIDAGGGGAFWMEFGFDHEFQLCPNLTFTPSLTVGVDHNFYNFLAGSSQNTTRFANMLWGLDLTYDMTEDLQIPEGWGSVAMSGFLYFSDALGKPEEKGLIQDEFFGGMSIGWSF